MNINKFATEISDSTVAHCNEKTHILHGEGKPIIRLNILESDVTFYCGFYALFTVHSPEAFIRRSRDQRSNNIGQTACH